MSVPSVNREAMKIVEEICAKPEKYNVIIKRNSSGAFIIDAGINAKGGFLVGKLITEICLGGLGEAYFSSMKMSEIELPSIVVYTDHPAISTLGSQLAGWKIRTGNYMAIGSGPARALALKPKKIYSKIKYKDDANEAVLVLEASKEPPEEVAKIISTSCRISPENLFLILAPTASVAGLTQISGRIVETGIHKLVELGLEPNLISYAWGQAPILPVHPNNIESMGRANDAILYGGMAHYVVSHEDDAYLRSLVERAVSLVSKDYGKPFSEIYEVAGQDFYKIDPKIFAPAKIAITNEKSGKTFTAGIINEKILLKSIGFSS
ncbi:MAG TPA: methenyltetrahydromethanopterin cyclohydrolase [Candidatus Bathyarchaeota archaeon]|nr:methenyltetrahydromethanopterin cyclohydrolase [Candidatus Bathyarchaeota archaeon]